MSDTLGYHSESIECQNSVGDGANVVERGAVNQEWDGVAPTTLGEEARARARARILQGATAALAKSGFSVTIDEVAGVAGVSRSTVFRHFATHGELLAAAIGELFQQMGDQMPAPPPPGTDIRAWLEGFAVATHEANRSMVGRAFWDIYADRPDVSPEVRRVLADWSRKRRQMVDELVTRIWSNVDGQGEPPPWVVEGFQVLHFSGFALPDDDAHELGPVGAHILWAALQTALAEQRGTMVDHLAERT